MIVKASVWHLTCTTITQDLHLRVTASFLENGQSLVKNPFLSWDQRCGKLYPKNLNY